MIELSRRRFEIVNLDILLVNVSRLGLLFSLGMSGRVNLFIIVFNFNNFLFSVVIVVIFVYESNKNI